MCRERQPSRACVCVRVCPRARATKRACSADSVQVSAVVTAIGSRVRPLGRVRVRVSVSVRVRFTPNSNPKPDPNLGVLRERLDVARVRCGALEAARGAGHRRRGEDAAAVAVAAAWSGSGLGSGSGSGSGSGFGFGSGSGSGSGLGLQPWPRAAVAARVADERAAAAAVAGVARVGRLARGRVGRREDGAPLLERALVGLVVVAALVPQQLLRARRLARGQGWARAKGEGRWAMGDGRRAQG